MASANPTSQETPPVTSNGLIAGGSNEIDVPVSEIGWEGVDKVTLSPGISEKVAHVSLERYCDMVKSPSFQSLAGQTLNTLAEIPALSHAQVEVGHLLGQGAMSSVYKIKSVESGGETSDSSNSSLGKKLQQNNPRSVVKFIKRETFQTNASTLPAYVVDLAKEGEFLAHLHHPNIIKMRGYSAGGLSNFSCGRNDSFFIILDQLQDNLLERINSWKLERRNPRLRFGGDRDFFLERLQIAVQIADAVAYMHSRSVIHRDLKPENAGFSDDGTVKLFDLDSCKLLPPSASPDETFRLTMRVGTLHYASPECYLGGKYNAKTDSYSFAILLHQILSMDKPFRDVDTSVFPDKVFSKGLRPRIPRAWPQSIRKILSDSWSGEVSKRPTMDEIHTTLSAAAHKMKTKHESHHGLLHSIWSCKQTAPDAVLTRRDPYD